jgi:tetratricopeptide (TPR) repeat protein
MSQAASDRNLLFGILALQMDFVSRDDLVVAMNAWVLDKQKSLGEILVAQGALTAGDREQQAIDALKRFGDVVSKNPDLKNNPALALLRKELLKEPLGFFKALRDRMQSDRDTRPEALSRLGSAAFDLAILTDEVGDKQVALNAYAESLAIEERLARENPAVTTDQSDLAISHNNIGNLLHNTGRSDAALEAHTKALAIRERLAREHPESPDHACELGGTLNNLALLHIAAKQYDQARTRLREAVAWQKKLAANPRNRTYRQFLRNHLLGLILANQGLGRADEASEAQRELEGLKATDPRFATLDARLAPNSKGEAPKGNAERLALAQRAYETARHALAARLWAEAFDADPKLADDRKEGHRYNAAGAAALAGSGQGNDDPPPDDAAKSRLRAQALGWLKAELATWMTLLETAKAEQRAGVVQTNQHWQQDADLAGVRDSKAIEALPESEREGWRTLWIEVAGALARTEKR